MIWLALVGCSENSLLSSGDRVVAVTYGDFDDLSPSLARLSVPVTPFDGLISNATWTDDEIDAPPLEDLFEGRTIRGHQALFIASGTRGLGRTIYNRNEPDDGLLEDPAVIDDVRSFVSRNGDLLVTDWAYDLTEVAWPDAVDWYGDDGVYDAAQHGQVTTLTARVTEPSLSDALGMDRLVLDYDFSNWAVIEDIGPDTTVWLRGDVPVYDGTGVRLLTDVPLLVSFSPESGPRSVVVMTFNANAQPGAAIDTILDHLMDLPREKR